MPGVQITLRRQHEARSARRRPRRRRRLPVSSRRGRVRSPRRRSVSRSTRSTCSRSTQRDPAAHDRPQRARRRRRPRPASCTTSRSTQRRDGHGLCAWRSASRVRERETALDARAACSAGRSLDCDPDNRSAGQTAHPFDANCAPSRRHVAWAASRWAWSTAADHRQPHRGQRRSGAPGWRRVHPLRRGGRNLAQRRIDNGETPAANEAIRDGSAADWCWRRWRASASSPDCGARDDGAICSAARILATMSTAVCSPCWRFFGPVMVTTTCWPASALPSAAGRAGGDRVDHEPGRRA